MLRYYCYRHHAADPFFNMAFDETMLDFVLERPDVILLRLYTWLPGAITVGLNQLTERAVRLPRLETTPLIRRVTGGRAVYHDPSELTYAVAVNPKAANLDAWRGTISDVYLHLAQALQTFLKSLGVNSKVVRQASDPERPPSGVARQPCFASAARYELVAAGGKIIASAQRRMKNAVLQHGSMKLYGIAAHPALIGVGTGDIEPQPIEKAQFDRLAEGFAQTWESILGGPPQMAPPPLETSETFTRRLATVRSRPLGRRDSFERSMGSKSL